jgi:hypothetical protein
MKNEKVDIEICSDDDINRVLHKLRSERWKYL